MQSIIKETGTFGIPIFQTVLETAQGGFVLDETVLALNSVLQAGTGIGYDEATRKAKVLKGGVMQAAATNVATTYRITKKHNLASGMTVTATGGTPRAINSIATADPNYDELTLAATLGVALNPGDQIYVNDDGFTKLRGLLKHDATVRPNEEIAVVIRGTVYNRRIPPMSTTTQKLMPNLFFSESF